MHSVEISEIFPHCENFSSNWFTVELFLFGEIFNLTKFLEKNRGGKNLQISTLCLRMYIHFYYKNFVKAMFLKLKWWFHEIFFSRKGDDSTVTQCNVEKMKNWLSPKIFRQINYLVISLMKPVLSRNFCKTSIIANFRNFHTVTLLCHIVQKNSLYQLFKMIL